VVRCDTKAVRRRRNAAIVIAVYAKERLQRRRLSSRLFQSKTSIIRAANPRFISRPRPGTASIAPNVERKLRFGVLEMSRRWTSTLAVSMIPRSFLRNIISGVKVRSTGLKSMMTFPGINKASPKIAAHNDAVRFGISPGKNHPARSTNCTSDLDAHRLHNGRHTDDQ